ncbi:PEPxxWA-CTERM sorting domain-containing protein [Phenylobacterium sp.]|uniref:PEPxxWA-CTERM sorting domain-containing protein n=1 Tax=Phenylobacterium sp. TaxID=1871053 RepID=UPI00374DDBC1
MKPLHLKSAMAAVAVLTAVSAQSARADSYFWAINQFATIQKLNGDTGAVVDSFAVPGLSGAAASVAIVGATGYYTQLGDNNIHKFDLATHADQGVAFTISGTVGYTNGITTDAAGHLWFADGGNGNLQEYSTAGVFLGAHAFPTDADSYRDGSVVFGNKVVTNRGDQEGPYDLYSLDGSMNGALTLVTAGFIGAGSGSNGIAFNGTNFYTSDEQAHKVSKWDINGNFVSIADLDQGSRYENWTFASQDIVPTGGVPEPATWAMMLVGFGGLGVALRRRRAVAFAA